MDKGSKSNRDQDMAKLWSYNPPIFPTSVLTAVRCFSQWKAWLKWVSYQGGNADVTQDTVFLPSLLCTFNNKAPCGGLTSLGCSQYLRQESWGWSFTNAAQLGLVIWLQNPRFLAVKPQVSLKQIFTETESKRLSWNEIWLVRLKSCPFPLQRLDRPSLCPLLPHT